MNLYYLAQFFGLIALITNVISILATKRKSIFRYNGASNIAGIVQYFLLNEKTGAISSIIATLRNVAFTRYKDRPPLYIFILYVAVSLAFNLPYYDGVMSLIPMLNIILYGYGLWQTNIETLKIINVISGFAGMVYDFHVRAYVSFISQTISFIAGLYSYKKYEKRRRVLKGKKIKVPKKRKFKKSK